MSYDRAFYAGTEALGSDGAVKLVRLLLDLAPVESAVDLGCGTGGWLSAFRQLGVEDVLGVDGEWVPREMLQIPPDRFLSHDLRRPLDLGRTFDLAVSLEVAEHLPASRSEAFVATLADAAPLVLFSAAVPGQGGVGHVNEQWPGYWAERFRRRGLRVIDPFRPALWNDASLATCIKQNALLYASEDALSRWPALAEAMASTDERRLAVVHPDQLAEYTDPRNMSLRVALAKLPLVAAAAARRRAPGRVRRTAPAGQAPTRADPS